MNISEKNRAFEQKRLRLMRESSVPKLCDAIRPYLERRGTLWKKNIPQAILDDPEASMRLMEPVWEIEPLGSNLSLEDVVRIVMIVPSVKNFQNGYSFKVSHEFPINDMIEYRDPIVYLKNLMDKIIEEYKVWCVAHYLECPPGCLIVWDDEHLPKESAKAYNLLRGEGTVRQKLGVMLIEDENGAVSVQLIQDPEKAKESFDQLSGRSGDKPSRATLLALDYDGSVVDAATKMLPVTQDKSNGPDMHVLGTGPVKFKKGWQEEVKEAFKEFTQ